jgi:hypothetical protein
MPATSLASLKALRARPVQAAFASAGSFAVGAVMPLIVSAVAPEATLIIFVSGTSLIFLALLGALDARGWRRCHAERNTRHVLGCAGYGNNRRRRGLVRYRRISGTKTTPASRPGLRSTASPRLVFPRRSTRPDLPHCNLCLSESGATGTTDDRSQSPPAFH